MSVHRKHTLEAESSWESHGARVRLGDTEGLNFSDERRTDLDLHRGLIGHHTHDEASGDDDVDYEAIEKKKAKEFLQKLRQEDKLKQKKLEIKKKEHKQILNGLLDDGSGIQSETVHGMMIDAGSSGSRMHVYEWKSRILYSEHEVRRAVSGGKLTFPGSNTRWTDRLRPGLSAFASLPDHEILEAVAEYLKPLLDFAAAVLHTKKADFADFPIYLRATAGLRVMPQVDRVRLIATVRTLFSNKTFCPFYFEQEYARTISGEEEAIFGWTGINFVMGNLLADTEGAGTVSNPRMTYGALDMGGASTQISFYEPSGDIMSNLFKLQIGQGKHWNLYAHSYLYYGIDEAVSRLEAMLINDRNVSARLVDGVYNPCLPGGASKDIRTDIHFNAEGFESWDYVASSTMPDGFQEGIIKNSNKGGDADACMAYAQQLMHKGQNVWCNFSHRGDCSFAGVYQPALPIQSAQFGKFLAFSNYFHVWQFLKLPSESSLEHLEAKARWACSLSRKELVEFNNGTIEDEFLDDYCFKSLFVFQVLHTGYGFKMTDNITAAEVIRGHKVDWAVGAMLYEINTYPWSYAPRTPTLGKPMEENAMSGIIPAFLAATAIGALVATALFLRKRSSRARRHDYQEIKGMSMNSGH